MATHSLPPVTASDRLGLTLFLAAALHAIVILGITFEASLGKKDTPPLTMEITLVHSKSDAAPEDPAYLAQVNQSGGGTMEERLRPSSPFPNSKPILEKGDAPQTTPAGAPRSQPQQAPERLTAEVPNDRLRAAVAKPQPESVPELPSALELMAQSREIARLAAEIDQKQKSYAQVPRSKTIGANTQEYKYASYLDGWRLKVERIGNLNYPDEAKRNALSGSLLLDVAIKADGSLVSTHVIRSSGHKILDDGAVRIVRLAAPFAPFPEDIKAETDILHIIRVWQFDSGNRFGTH